MDSQSKVTELTEELHLISERYAEQDEELTQVKQCLDRTRKKQLKLEKTNRGLQRQQLDMEAKLSAVTHELAEAKSFSILDAGRGYWKQQLKNQEKVVNHFPDKPGRDLSQSWDCHTTPAKDKE